MSAFERFEELDARVRAEGWQRGYPRSRGRVLVNGVSIDHETCVSGTCEECGHHGLTYVAYFDPDRQISASGYNAVWHCPACDAAAEF